MTHIHKFPLGRSGLASSGTRWIPTCEWLVSILGKSLTGRKSKEVVHDGHGGDSRRGKQNKTKRNASVCAPPQWSQQGIENAMRREMKNERWRRQSSSRPPGQAPSARPTRTQRNAQCDMREITDRARPRACTETRTTRFQNEYTRRRIVRSSRAGWSWAQSGPTPRHPSDERAYYGANTNATTDHQHETGMVQEGSEMSSGVRWEWGGAGAPPQTRRDTNPNAYAAAPYA
ncbi:hypothetical protein B0H16DRAFT_1692990 [Mycena metata]|uniref:Uncharacterized protein n=1 Tax=Mycena metata TaxID=1033252 RepID=A0AAD7N4K6_9AGAR|nr:hypothetical protein B0H16DRAFT_1692990 [Mycena metata]